MKYHYKYCSNCGELFDKKSDIFYVCPKCDFRIFISPKPGTGAFIFNDKEQLLMVKRSIEPNYGKWGIPGGFIDPGESAPVALTREIKEELGICINKFTYFGSYSADYLHKDINYKLLNTYYLAEIDNVERINLLETEASELKFIYLKQIKVEDVASDISEAIIELIQSKLH